VDTGSRQENASNKNLEPRFDSIETEKALDLRCEARCPGWVKKRTRLERPLLARSGPPEAIDLLPIDKTEVHTKYL
jgi:hypothetical protein